LEKENAMSKPAVDCDDMPDHPEAPKSKKVSAHVGGGATNSFIKGGKGKKGKKGRRKHAAK
jgi:hypothetical protein